MLKKVLGFVLILLFITIIVDQYRKIYCISDNKCITVWKRIGGTCYIAPYKYYGIFKPRDCYVITTNSSNIDVIWKNEKEIIVQIDENSSIVSNSNEKIKILDYEANNEIYDSIFTYKEGHYLKYKKNVQFISISILENYGMSSNGSMH